jgi:hypothetical protein
MKPPLPGNVTSSSRRVKVTVDLGNPGISIDDVVLDPLQHRDEPALRRSIVGNSTNDLRASSLDLHPITSRINHI